MKKTIRKILTLALCLTLLLSMSAMVSAVTITWGSGTDARTLIMNATRGTHDVLIAPAGAYVHDGTTDTKLTYSGSFTATVSASHIGDYADFMLYVNQAMTQEGMEASNTITITEASHTVLANETPGRYMLCVRFHCKNASWSVNPGIIGKVISYPTSGTGTISHAPTGNCTIEAKIA